MPQQDYVDQGSWDNSGGAAPTDQNFVDNGTWDQPTDNSGGGDAGWDAGGGGGDSNWDSGGGGDSGGGSDSLC